MTGALVTLASTLLGACAAISGGMLGELWRARRAERVAVRLVMSELTDGYQRVAALHDRSTPARGRAAPETLPIMRQAWDSLGSALAQTATGAEVRLTIQQAYTQMEAATYVGRLPGVSPDALRVKAREALSTNLDAQKLLVIRYRRLHLNVDRSIDAHWQTLVSSSPTVVARS